MLLALYVECGKVYWDKNPVLMRVEEALISLSFFSFIFCLNVGNFESSSQDLFLIGNFGISIFD